MLRIYIYIYIRDLAHAECNKRCSRSWGVYWSQKLSSVHTRYMYIYI